MTTPAAGVIVAADSALVDAHALLAEQHVDVQAAPSMHCVLQAVVLKVEQRLGDLAVASVETSEGLGVSLACGLLSPLTPPTRFSRSSRSD
jgi:hypothetical protein